MKAIPIGNWRLQLILCWAKTVHYFQSFICVATGSTRADSTLCRANFLDAQSHHAYVLRAHVWAFSHIASFHSEIKALLCYFFAHLELEL